MCVSLIGPILESSQTPAIRTPTTWEEAMTTALEISNEAELDDAELIAAVRRGETDAFAELYHRHEHVLLAYARRRTRSAESAADVVAEAYARLLAILMDGRGPGAEVAPYLMRTVRNLSVDMGTASRRTMATDDTRVLEQVVPFCDEVLATEERGLARRAFVALPARWRRVLEYTCLRGLSPEEAAREMGITPTALTSLAYRAREGLRQAFLQAHAPSAESPACGRYRSRIGSLVRGGLGPEAASRVSAHVMTCASCREVEADLADLNSTFRQPLPGETLATDTEALRPAS
jgi:RNA polymerase sigma factor (sigma-70 family)